MITGTPQFAPWIEDPDPPDYWDEDDWKDFGRRMAAYFAGRLDELDDATWREELHPREKGQFTFSGGSDDDEHVVAYHGTVEDVAEKIGKQGITVQRSKTFARVNPHFYEGERGQSVYITSSQEDALTYAIAKAKAGRTVAGNPVVFRLEVPQSEWNKFKADEYHAGIGRAKFRKKAIPAKWIKAYTVFDQPLIGVFAPKPKTKHEVKLRDVEESAVTIYMVVWADKDGVKDAKLWDPTKHPRGHSSNPGRFSETGGDEVLLPRGEARAPRGGGRAEANKAVYKGGQYLPSTDAPPGTWRIKAAGKTRNIGMGEVRIEPGKRVGKPTPVSISIYEELYGGEFIVIDKATGQGTINPRINWDYFGAQPHEKEIRHFGNLATTEERYSVNDLIEMYNRGERWIEPKLNPDVEVIAKGDPIAKYETEAKKLHIEPPLPKGRIEMIERVTKATAAEHGIPADQVFVDKSATTYNVNDEENMAAGTCNLKTLEIIIYPKNLYLDGVMGSKEKFVRGIVIHEIAHLKYQTVRNAITAEAQAFKNNPNIPTPLIERFMPHNKQSAMQARRKGDGTTNYSKGFWKDFEADLKKFSNPSKFKFYLAQHETIAEMTRVDDATGSLKGANVAWKRYYSDVMKTWDELQAKKKK